MSARSFTLDRQPLADVPTALKQTSAAAVLATRVPFQGPREEVGAVHVPLEGKLPDWLRGTLLRTAPMFGAKGVWQPSHWFDALALIFGVELGGPEVTLRWARSESNTSRAARAGRVPVMSFATPNERGFFSRLFGPIPAITDNANVNIVRLGNELLAMTESPHQWQLDRRDYRVDTPVHYDRDDMVRGASMLAHPIVSNDGVVNLAYKLARNARVMLYTHAPESRRRQILGQWITRDLPYLHSFGLTERAGIVVAHPFTARPPSMLWSNRGFIDHFKWQPERGARLVVIDRSTGEAREHETDPFFSFHVVHAFETEKETVIDLLAFDDAKMVDRLRASSLLAGFPANTPKLRRYSIDRASGKVRHKELSDVGFEFPQMDWKLAGRNPNRVHGAAIAPREGKLASEIVSIEFESGVARKFREGDWIFGEPLFVGRPGRTIQGEGALLAIGSRENASSLFVLDALSLEPLARAEFPTPLPLGFHGTFVRA